MLGGGALQHMMKVIPAPLQCNLFSWSRLGSMDFDKLKGSSWEPFEGWSGGFRWTTIGFRWFAKIIFVSSYIRFPLYIVDPLSCILCTSLEIIQNPICLQGLCHIHWDLNVRSVERTLPLDFHRQYFVVPKHRIVRNIYIYASSHSHFLS